MVELFHQYWWLIFPIGGMLFVAFTMGLADRRSRALMDMIKTYVDQGKEPPPELMRALSQSMEDTGLDAKPKNEPPQQSRAWPFLVFTAASVGAGVAYHFEQHYIFLAVAAAMGVLAAGSLALLIFGRGKS